jgi:hypothetical protein
MPALGRLCPAPKCKGLLKERHCASHGCGWRICDECGQLSNGEGLISTSAHTEN